VFFHRAIPSKREAGAVVRHGRRAAAVLPLLAALLLAVGCGAFPGGETAEDISWFTIFLVIMTSVVVLLLLILIFLLSRKMNRLMSKLDALSEDASKFVKMGMTFFKKK